MFATPNRFLLSLVGLMLFAVPALAEPTAAGGTASSILGMVPFALMFVVVYLLMVRPAQQQRSKQEQLLAGLKKDDEVVTQSGFIGRIVSLEDQVVTLELGERVRVRMLRDRITGPWQTTERQAVLRAVRPRSGKLS